MLCRDIKRECPDQLVLVCDQFNKLLTPLEDVTLLFYIFLILFRSAKPGVYHTLQLVVFDQSRKVHDFSDR